MSEIERAARAYVNEVRRVVRVCGIAPEIAMTHSRAMDAWRSLVAIESSPPEPVVTLTVEEARAAASCAECVGREGLAAMFRYRIAEAREVGS